MRILSYILIILLLGSCAQVKTPTGGSKDIEGPEITSSYPTHLETNYNAKSIAISFNELVTLTDPKNNIIITPPLKNKPEIYILLEGTKVMIGAKQPCGFLCQLWSAKPPAGSLYEIIENQAD